MSLPYTHTSCLEAAPPHPPSTYVLKMNVGLAGDVVDNISDVLLSAAADEVLLRSSVLQKDKRTDTQLKL